MSVQGGIRVARNYNALEVEKELSRRGVSYAKTISIAIKAEAICRSFGLQEYLANGKKYTVDKNEALGWFDKNQDWFEKLAFDSRWQTNPQNAARMPARVVVPLKVHLDEYAVAINVGEKFSYWLDGVNEPEYDEWYTTPAQRKLFRVLVDLNSKKTGLRGLSHHKLASIIYNAWSFDRIIPMDESEYKSEPSDEYLFTDFDFTEVM